ncbi:MAG: acetyl-CoA C-acetyltransferase [Dehalococcoidia bacterium]|nr:acetyl-CoA C-acetyltransferase [Dehalococcoidia bacterium]
MEQAVIVSAARTPVGSFGGSLAEIPVHKLGSVAIAEAVKRAGIQADQIEEVLMGNVLSAGAGMNVARQAALDAKLPISVPATIINKVCGSSIKTVALAAQAIRVGDADIIVAGGMESMSNAPYLLSKARYGYRLGHGELLDSILSDGLTCSIAHCHMGITSENLSTQYEISRDEQDRFALTSQQRAAKAVADGKFNDEIVKVTVPQARGEAKVVDKDEHLRPDTSMERLARLRPAFKEGGTVTAGNASGINDAGAAFVVMSTTRAQQLNMKPMAIIRSYASAGVQPEIMGIGPVPAIRKALEKGGLRLEDMDLIELNEAFAGQSLAVGRELNLDWNKVNVNGGAIALGHPLGASGARILTTLLYEMKRRHSHYGLVSLCIGGGQGIAMVVEAA